MRIHEPLKSFILHGNSFLYQDVLEENIDLSDKSEFEIETFSIINKWLSAQKNFLLKTSGSTGKPKIINFSKEKIKKSALRTIKTFHLNPGQTVLNCLNTAHVAGLLMLVRAIEGNLNLIIESPAANPLVNIDEGRYIDFCAMTPYQAETILNDTPSKFANINTILIGGAALNPSLERRFHNVQSNIYQSYSMTETLTHVAIRKVNGIKKSNIYHALQGVSFSQDSRGCLIIYDQTLEIDALITNDMVHLVDNTSFKWIGRYDNVINTGGIKIHIEGVEEEIYEILGDLGLQRSFCLLSIPDQKLTNKLVLLIEESDIKIDTNFLLLELKRKLPKYHEPKTLIKVPELILTKSGKIDRKRNTEKYLHEYHRLRK